MPAKRFEELTKTLAGATTRRQALRAMAVATIGGVVGIGTAGTAFASNSDCAKFCASVFGANTPAANQCTSDAAHKKGLCYTCGPSSPGGGVTPADICCARTSSGYCASYTGAACCASGLTCQNGQCVTVCPPSGSVNAGTCAQDSDCCSGNCTNGYCCDAGRVGLDNGSCALPCAGTTSTSCTACGDAAYCGADTSSSYYCAHGPFSSTFCEDDSACPAGQYCNDDGILCQALC